MANGEILSTIFGIIGMSKVRALPLGVEVECSVHYFGDYFGQSEVKVLPLGIASECSVHYFVIIFQVLPSFWITYFFPKRGYPSVLKF